VTLNEGELRQVVRICVEETLTKFGVDVESPLEMQHDFAQLREWRKAKEVIVRRGVLTILGVAILGVMTAFIVGFKDLLLGQGPSPPHL
jgi:hypothetical protein